MNVLMISSDKSISKEQSHAQERMKKYGSLVDSLDIILFCSRKDCDSSEIFLSENTRVVLTRSFFKIFYPFSAVLKSLKINHNIDLVTTQDPFEAGLAGFLISKIKKCKLQLQVHTDFLSQYFAMGSFKNRVRVVLGKRLLPRGDSIRVVSERIKKSLSTLNCQMSKVFILPIFVDPEEIEKRPILVNLREKYPEFDFIILMASRLEREKNVSLGIIAFSEVLKKRPNAGLVIAGSGSRESNLRNLVAGLGLEKSVKFEGWVQDLSSYFKTADVYLLTSDYEGYGMTLIQSAACGCPIVTTDVGVVGEAINKENSIVVDIGDKEGVISALERMILSEDLRKNLSENGKKSIDYLGTEEDYLKDYKKHWE